MGSPVRFTHVLDQGNMSPLQLVQQPVLQSVEALDMGEEYRARPFRNRRKNLVGIHGQCPWIDIDEDRRKSILYYRCYIGHPGQRRNDDLPSLRMTDLEDSHGQKISRSSGIDEHTVFDTKPCGPFGFEGSHVRPMRQDRIFLFEMLNDGIQIFAKNIVAHQWKLHKRLLAF